MLDADARAKSILFKIAHIGKRVICSIFGTIDVPRHCCFALLHQFKSVPQHPDIHRRFENHSFRLALFLIGLVFAASASAAHAEFDIGRGTAGTRRVASGALGSTANSKFADQLKGDKDFRIRRYGYNEIRRRKSRGAKSTPGDNV